jgi:hypothetical protein
MIGISKACFIALPSLARPDNYRDAISRHNGTGSRLSGQVVSLLQTYI